MMQIKMENNKVLIPHVSKFGHKFTNRKINNKYVINWSPGNVIELIYKARTNNNRIFSRYQQMKLVLFEITSKNIGEIFAATVP